MGRRRQCGVAVGTVSPVPDLALVAGWLMCCVALRCASRPSGLVGVGVGVGRNGWIYGFDCWRKRGSQ